MKPYRDGGPALYPRNIPTLESAIEVKGTINDASDTDISWDVELKIPLKDLAKYVMMVSN